MLSSFSLKREKRGFTLIELLIVIAIILILIAIALPNFLEAQIRARVTKAKGELRTLGIAQEAYYLDWKIYPAEHERDSFVRNQTGLYWLTSPIKYITSIPTDPFAAFGADEQIAKGYVTYESGGIENGGNFLTEKCTPCLHTYVIFSNGPDAKQDITASHAHCDNVTSNYSPTNGTNSGGSIYYWGGDGWWIGVTASATKQANARNMPIVPVVMDNVPYVHRLPRF